MESTEGEGSTFYVSLPYEPYEGGLVGMMKLSEWITRIGLILMVILVYIFQSISG